MSAMVEIIAVPKSAMGPIWVHFKPKLREIDDPVSFQWLFGDGQESSDKMPPAHYYDMGRYNVMLEVTDKSGKKYTAGITVDSASPG
ncbi:MAG: PKD domain-containing protein [Nitrospirae bacterium]|nr:PKD domain-containing protein [Nitrospirota bacterium]MCL5976949.1 PKD domain-containing protein [Nitrospirota bacterium]